MMAVQLYMLLKKINLKLKIVLFTNHFVLQAKKELFLLHIKCIIIHQNMKDLDVYIHLNQVLQVLGN